MIEVNAVDSFCDLKSIYTTGNGEKTLYLSSTNSLDFITNYLGISILKGTNIYDYNDEVRVRTRGLSGYITRSNIQEYFDATINEYSKTDIYRGNLEQIKAKNKSFLNKMNEKEYFEIDCRLSDGRIYIGSKDINWYFVPSFSIPNKTKIRIVNLNNSDEVQFELIHY